MARRFQEITEVYRQDRRTGPLRPVDGISALCLPEL